MFNIYVGNLSFEATEDEIRGLFEEHGEVLIHRIMNPGNIPLVFVEVQMGAYFGEDDIIRLEDDYGRSP